MSEHLNKKCKQQKIYIFFSVLYLIITKYITVLQLPSPPTWVFSINALYTLIRSFIYSLIFCNLCPGQGCGRATGVKQR